MMYSGKNGVNQFWTGGSKNCSVCKNDTELCQKIHHIQRFPTPIKLLRYVMSYYALSVRLTSFHCYLK